MCMLINVCRKLSELKEELDKLEEDLINEIHEYFEKFKKTAVTVSFACMWVSVVKDPVWAPRQIPGIMVAKNSLWLLFVFVVVNKGLEPLTYF